MSESPDFKSPNTGNCVPAKPMLYYHYDYQEQYGDQEDYMCKKKDFYDQERLFNASPPRDDGMSPKSNNMFVCDVCNEKFMNIHFLSKHYKQHAIKSINKCKQCGQCFKEKYQLLEHQLEHARRKEVSSLEELPKKLGKLSSARKLDLYENLRRRYYNRWAEVTSKCIPEKETLNNCISVDTDDEMTDSADEGEQMIDSADEGEQMIISTDIGGRITDSANIGVLMRNSADERDQMTDTADVEDQMIDFVEEGDQEIDTGDEGDQETDEDQRLNSADEVNQRVYFTDEDQRTNSAVEENHRTNSEEEDLNMMNSADEEGHQMDSEGEDDQMTDSADEGEQVTYSSDEKEHVMDSTRKSQGFYLFEDYLANFLTGQSSTMKSMMEADLKHQDDQLKDKNEVLPPPITFICEKCNVLFKSEGALVLHYQQHSSFQCSYCSQAYKYTKHLYKCLPTCLRMSSSLCNIRSQLQKTENLSEKRLEADQGRENVGMPPKIRPDPALDNLISALKAAVNKQKVAVLPKAVVNKQKVAVLTKAALPKQRHLKTKFKPKGPRIKKPICPLKATLKKPRKSAISQTKWPLVNRSSIMDDTLGVPVQKCLTNLPLTNPDIINSPKSFSMSHTGNGSQDTKVSGSRHSSRQRKSSMYYDERLYVKTAR